MYQGALGDLIALLRGDVEIWDSNTRILIIPGLRAPPLPTTRGQFLLEREDVKRRRGV